MDMGCTYQFRCEDCGLAAEVSGGADRGFYSETRTVWCANCSLLDDVEVARDTSDSHYPTGSQKFEEVTPICHHCKGSAVTIWQNGQPCPKCGGSMTRSKGIVEFWD
jgi:hypothetical protein